MGEYSTQTLCIIGSILAQAAKNAVRASTATQLVLSVRGVQVLVLVNFLGKETMGLDIFYHERLSSMCYNCF